MHASGPRRITSQTFGIYSVYSGKGAVKPVPMISPDPPLSTQDVGSLLCEWWISVVASDRIVSNRTKEVIASLIVQYDVVRVYHLKQGDQAGHNWVPSLCGGTLFCFALISSHDCRRIWTKSGSQTLYSVVGNGLDSIFETSKTIYRANTTGFLSPWWAIFCLHTFG